MRLPALILLALALTASVAVAASQVPGGTLEVRDARGAVLVTGKGVIVGRVDKGSLKIVDLSPADQWSPWVNGVPRGKVVWLRGQNITFRISAGRYRIAATGDGISLSARGTGSATLDGDPDAVGDTGMFRVGDGQFAPLPTETTKEPFGPKERGTTSGASVKMP